MWETAALRAFTNLYVCGHMNTKLLVQQLDVTQKKNTIYKQKLYILLIYCSYRLLQKYAFPTDRPLCSLRSRHTLTLVSNLTFFPNLQERDLTESILHQAGFNLKHFKCLMQGHSPGREKHVHMSKTQKVLVASHNPVFRCSFCCNKFGKNYARSVNSRSFFIHRSAAFYMFDSPVPVELWNSGFHNVTRGDLLTYLKFTRKWY